MDGTQRVINGIYRWLTDRGPGAEFRQILTVRGRKSGESPEQPDDD